MDGHIIPTSNANYDLGSAEYKIRHLFLSDNSLWIGDDHKIDISGGKMRFKKRKKGAGFVPKEILDASENSTPQQHIDGVIALFENVSSVNDIKLYHWETWVANTALSGVTGLLPHELFQKDDNFEENVENESKETMFTNPTFTGKTIMNDLSANDASFNNAYIEELTISQSSLFMDNGDGTKTKILHKEGSDLKLDTTTNQNMTLSTSGSGVLKFQSLDTGNLVLNSGNNLQLDASGNIELQSSNSGTINIKSKLNITNGVKIESTGDYVEIFDGLKVQNDISGQNIFATGKGVFDNIETTSLSVNGTTIDTNGGGGTSLTTTSDISINAIDAQDASFNSLNVNGVDITPTVQEGQIIEIVSGTCDGRDVIAKSGTYTLPNVTAVQALTETYTDITGSSISYKPPAGTRYVKYSNRFHLSYDTAGGTWAHAGVQLYIDDVAQGTINFIGNDSYGDEYETAEWIIAIGDTTDASGIKLSEWTSNKTLKIKMRERNSSRQSQLHKANYLDSVGGNNNDILQPSLTITAIGQSSIIGGTSNSVQLPVKEDSGAPTTTPGAGTMVFNTGDNKLYIYNGTVWKSYSPDT
jgi:hypothetical protein